MNDFKYDKDLEEAEDFIKRAEKMEDTCFKIKQDIRKQHEETYRQYRREAMRLREISPDLIKGMEEQLREKEMLTRKMLLLYEEIEESLNEDIERCRNKKEENRNKKIEIERKKERKKKAMGIKSDEEEAQIISGYIGNCMQEIENKETAGIKYTNIRGAAEYYANRYVQCLDVMKKFREQIKSDAEFLKNTALKFAEHEKNVAQQIGEGPATSAGKEIDSRYENDAEYYVSTANGNSGKENNPDRSFGAALRNIDDNPPENTTEN